MASNERLPACLRGEFHTSNKEEIFVKFTFLAKSKHKIELNVNHKIKKIMTAPCPQLTLCLAITRRLRAYLLNQLAPACSGSSHSDSHWCQWPRNIWQGGVNISSELRVVCGLFFLAESEEVRKLDPSKVNFCLMSAKGFNERKWAKV